jgi:RNA polymerase sigma-70 factor (ECF subfamily)
LQSEQSADLIYDAVWAETIMQKAARRLRDEYSAAGKTALYEEVRPCLARETRAGEYAAAAQRLGMSESAVAVAVHRLRQKFREFVRDEVGHTVQSPAEVDDEMRHLLRVLTAPDRL